MISVRSMPTDPVGRAGARVTVPVGTVENRVRGLSQEVADGGFRRLRIRRGAAGGVSVMSIMATPGGVEGVAACSVASEGSCAGCTG